MADYQQLQDAVTSAQNDYTNAVQSYSTAETQLQSAVDALDAANNSGDEAAIAAAQSQVDSANAAIETAQTNITSASNAVDAANAQLTDAQAADETRSTNAVEGQAAQAEANAPTAAPDNGDLAGQTTGPSLLSQIGSGASKLLNQTLGILDPSNARLAVAGLFSGGANSNAQAGITGQNIRVQAGTSSSKDWRVRLSLPTSNPIFYNQSGSLQSILARTNGLIFPYTPTVSVTHNARYQEQSLTHSNYKSYFYEGSDVAAITINGDFTVQNLDEGQYLLAALYFLRSATKMFWGNETNAGNPPPIVFLDGYGDFYFPHVSCVVTNFTHTMPPDCDYVEIPISGSSSSTVRLPTTSALQVTVQPVYSRKNQYNNFTLDKFSQGQLLTGKGGFL